MTKERDDTKAGAASAKVVPLWPASIRTTCRPATSNRLPGASEPTSRTWWPRRTPTTWTWRQSSGSPRSCSRSLRAPATPCRSRVPGLRLTNGTGGCWELVDQNGTVLGLIVAIDGRLVLAPTSWSRREVLAAGGAVLLAPLAGLGARAATASGGDTSPPPDPEAAARLDYVMQHPRSVDMAAAAHLRERAESLAKQYDLAASTSLLPAAGECIGQVTFLRARPRWPVLRELQVTEAQLATLMGQLVWDASQRRGPRHCRRLLRPGDLRRQPRGRDDGGGVCAPAEELSRCTANTSRKQAAVSAAGSDAGRHGWKPCPAGSGAPPCRRRLRDAR